MRRNKHGQFAKGHLGYGRGSGWKNEKRICKCGRIFFPAKKFSASCSQHCAMLGTKRRLGHKLSPTLKHRLRKTMFKKGFTPWNKGRKTGLAPWKGKKRPDISGENHHNWQSGITPKNEAFRKSPEYKVWRTKVYKRDNYQCVIGGKRHGNELQADHIKSFAKYPELRLEVKNGRTLCKACHIKTDTYGHRTK